MLLHGAKWCSSNLALCQVSAVLKGTIPHLRSRWGLFYKMRWIVQNTATIAIKTEAGTTTSRR